MTDSYDGSLNFYDINGVLYLRVVVDGEPVYDTALSTTDLTQMCEFFGRYVG